MPLTSETDDPQTQLQHLAKERWGDALTEDQDRKQFSNPEWTYDEWLEANPDYADRLRSGEVKVLRKRIYIFRPEEVENYSEKAWKVTIHPTTAARLRRNHQEPAISRGETFVPKSECIEHEAYIACPIWTLT
ncbi:MAG: hypothetical protein ABEI52_07755 [Halobacteriaceae archaeon]